MKKKKGRRTPLDRFTAILLAVVMAFVFPIISFGDVFANADKSGDSKCADTTMKYTIQKKWSGDKETPSSIDVNVYKDSGSSVYKTVTLEASEGWTKTIDVAEGSTYTVKEDAVENYTPSYSYTKGLTYGGKIESTSNDVKVGSAADKDNFFVAIKQAQKVSVWYTGTVDTTALEALVKAKDPGSKFDFEFHQITTSWIDNATEFTVFPGSNNPQYATTAKIYISNGNLYFQAAKDKWSHLDYGTTGSAGAVITNTYSGPSPATAQIKTSKEVSSTNDKYTGTEDFSFTLTASTSGAPLPASNTASCKSGGTAEFGSITFDQAGTYIYQISENKPAAAAAGMTYDTSDRYAKVVVTKDDASNSLTSAVTYGKTSSDINSGSLTITNTYSSISAGLKVSKKVVTAKDSTSSYKSSTGDSFTFALKPANENAKEVLSDDGITASCEDNATAEFSSISFTKEGTYLFSITEQKGSVEGMTYDAASKYAKVEISKDNSGKLAASVKYGTTSDACTADSLSVTNTYCTTTAKLSLSKQVTGDKYTGDEVFGFTLDRVTEGAPLPGSTSASCKDGKTASFGDITYSNEGTYIYKVTETTGTTASMTYAKDPLYAKVVVTNTAGTLTSKVTYGSTSIAANITGSTLTFVNSYSKPYVPTTTADIEVSKEVTTTDGSAQTYSGNEDFIFTLAADTLNAPLPAQTSATCKAGGTADFGSIKYTEAGDYWYTITEVKGTDEHMTYDTTVKYVHVKVTEATPVEQVYAARKAMKAASVQKTLSATVTYGPSKLLANDEALTITNTYYVPPVSDKTSYSVEKKWADNENAGNTRPDKIMVQLYANGQETGQQQELNANNDWSFTWNDLRKTNDSGHEIVYTAAETQVPDNYTGTVEYKNGKTTITNTYTPYTPPLSSKGNLNVTKSVTLDGASTTAISGTFYVTVFTDAGCTQIAAGTSTQAITISNGTASSASFTGLDPGTYYIAETNEDGTSLYGQAPYIEGFMSGSADGSMTAVVVTGNATAEAAITNEYTTATPPQDPKTPGTTTSADAPKDAAPDTSDPWSNGTTAFLMIMAAGGLFTAIFLRRKEW